MPLDRDHAHRRCIITQESLSEWFHAGIICAGMGSKLIERELVASKDWAGITAKVEKTIEMIKQIRSGE